MYTHAEKDSRELAGAAQVATDVPVKFICPSCESLASLEFASMQGATLVLWCVRCAGEVRVETRLPPIEHDVAQGPEAESASNDVLERTIEQFEPPLVAPEVVPAMVASKPAVSFIMDEALIPPASFCPKCVSPRKPGPSCNRCGLVFSRFNPREYRPSEELVNEWKRLEQHWPSTEAHQRFTQRAVELGELPSAGRMYQIRLAWHPGDAMAERGRNQAQHLASEAVAAAFAFKAARPDAQRFRKLFGVLLVLMFAAMAFGLVFKMFPMR